MGKHLAGLNDILSKGAGHVRRATACPLTVGRQEEVRLRRVDQVLSIAIVESVRH